VWFASLKSRLIPKYPQTQPKRLSSKVETALRVMKTFLFQFNINKGVCGMDLLTRQGRALLLATAVVVAAWLSGCGGDDNPSSGEDNNGSNNNSNNGGGSVRVVDPGTVVKSTFTDSRNGQTYKTVKIGSQTWMVENLNMEAGTSWCYGDDDSNCDAYGRLYDWAMAKTICPAGWKLPDTADWNRLGAAVGGQSSHLADRELVNISWLGAGTKLKSTSGWNDFCDVGEQCKSGNGTDDYGFSALPGGGRVVFNDVGRFGNAGTDGYWWTVTKVGDYDAAAYHRDMAENRDSMDEYAGIESYGFSVRCLKD
jgi:uncharacterized protein (TIGR02145 family)